MNSNALVEKTFAMMTLDQKKQTAQELFENLGVLLLLIHKEDPTFELE